MKEYGSLSKVFDNTDKITNKRVHDGLKNCKEDALLSKELVTIIKDVDIECSIENFVVQSFDQDALVKKYEELEFHALLRQIGSTNDSLKTKNIEKKYISITSKKDLKK